MRGRTRSWLGWITVAALQGAPVVVSQTPHREALVVPLDCANGDCPLLRGVPQTAGMRSGFVRLTPGQKVGRHTTAKNEETLVVLHGRGKALLDDGKNLIFAAPAIVYIPPQTHHDVLNTGKEMLEYVYVVAPAEGQ